MEPDRLKVVDSNPLEFQLGSYTVRIALDGKRIAVRAYSDISSKLFEGVLQAEDLSEQDKFAFDDCK